MNCKADIPTINIGISNQVKMTSNGATTGDGYTILTKQINGVAAGQSATVWYLLNIGTKCNKISI